MNTTAILMPIFTTSSPATRPAFAQEGGSWRVVHFDRAIATAESILGTPCWAEGLGYNETSNGRRLAIVIGVKSAATIEQVTALVNGLKAHGYTASHESGREVVLVDSVEQRR